MPDRYVRQRLCQIGITKKALLILPENPDESGFMW